MQSWIRPARADVSNRPVCRAPSLIRFRVDQCLNLRSLHCRGHGSFTPETSQFVNLIMT